MDGREDLSVREINVVAHVRKQGGIARVEQERVGGVGGLRK